MITVDLNKTILFPALLVVAGILITVLVSDLFKVNRENQSLRKAMELVEDSIEKEKKIILVKVDSLQEIITQQNNLNTSLKEEISALEKAKDKIKSKADERKDDILRIRAVDSLYGEISRHYGR